jgi:hypothetical protein
MKAFLSFAFIYCCLACLHAQATLTGARTGGAYKLMLADTSAAPENRPYGDLDVDKLLPKQLVFSLEYNSGAPSFVVINFSGTAISKDGKVYLYKDKEKLPHCNLKFTVKGAAIEIRLLSTAKDCGFSWGADPGGRYVKYAD